MKNAKYLSCESIQNALYLAPDEIKTCCKRFWHLDEFKVDVVITPEIEIDEDKINIVTSIGVDNNAVFQKIRGADKLDAVIEDVRVYSEINPINVTIKYITMVCTGILPALTPHLNQEKSLFTGRGHILSIY
jgi:hypothetical protein